MIAGCCVFSSALGSADRLLYRSLLKKLDDRSQVEPLLRLDEVERIDGRPIRKGRFADETK